jgi:hypothetical protein
MTLIGDGPSERVSVVLESDGEAGTLGVDPVFGRRFSESERRAGIASAAAILSHALWQTRFGGDPSAIGRTLRFDTQATGTDGQEDAYNMSAAHVVAEAKQPVRVGIEHGARSGATAVPWAEVRGRRAGIERTLNQPPRRVASVTAE